MISFYPTIGQSWEKLCLLTGYWHIIFFIDTFFGFGSELVIIFLKFLYERDPVRQLLEASDADDNIEIDLYVIFYTLSSS